VARHNWVTQWVPGQCRSECDARCIGVALATLARRHVAKHLVHVRPTPLPGSEPAIPASHSSAHTPYGYQFEAALAAPVVGRGWRRPNPSVRP